MTDDIIYSTIPELAGLLRTRKISALELTRAYLERLERLGPQYNAVAALTRKRAEDRARDADDLFKLDRVRSPLQGIPYGAKDLLAAKGAPTTWGAEPYRSQVFDYDATIIRKLERAGSPLAAKLAMIPLAGAGGYRPSGPHLFGPCKNPWNPAHWS